MRAAYDPFAVAQGRPIRSVLMAGVGRKKLSVTERQIRDGLAKVMTPLGVPLTQANALSEIAINDGKVYFSINVDATQAQAWAEVRAKAEAAVRAIPGVTVAMVVLTAERRAGARLRRSRKHARKAFPMLRRTGHMGAPARGCRSRPKFRVSPRSSRSRPAKAGWESPRPR